MDQTHNEVSSEEFERIGRTILESALKRAAGQEHDYCEGGIPSRQYYISNLTPQSRRDDDSAFTETTPSTIGIQVEPNTEESTAEIGIAFEVYVRCLPTYDEYVEEVGENFNVITQKFFTKCQIQHRDTIDLDDVTNEAVRLTREVNNNLQTEISDVEANRVIHPPFSLADEDLTDLVGHTVSDVTTLSRSEYEQLLNTVDNAPDLDHEWNLEITIERRDGELVLKLTNDAPDSQTNVDDDLTLFNPEIRISGDLKPYELDIVSEDFRYDRRVWGKGHNCAVSTTKDEPDPKGNVTIQTETVPQHQTHRFVHRGEEDQYESDIDPLIDIEAEFDTSLETLWEGDVTANLGSMADGMRQYLSEWEGSLRREKREELDADGLNAFDEAAQKFRREIDNFERGIDALGEKPEAMQAFRMMNRAFVEQPDEHGIPAWRPFQIVFIVSNISSLLAREFDKFESYRDKEVEVLWFPTGGGKTEAYLGLIVFGLFFDRLRGKERGVTAWIRFPLTLLGSQQLRRFLRILTHANGVKKSVGLPGERFSIGYYAGSGNTPNRIGGWNNYKEQFEGPNGDEVLRDECQAVDSCPKCESEIDMRWDSDEHAVYHKCPATDCDLDTLPLYVTDHEIYRNVPSVLLGTLDKITVVGSNPRFANLIGNLTSHCPVHGYGYSGKCSESTTIDCDCDVETVDDQFYDPIPSLHLIDEVHLLGEELGVFAGHYETLYLELCEQLHGETPKIVTSTATISERERGDGVPSYERHVQNLFMRDANRFPEDGPELGESFYGTTTEERLRRYYGIAPRNKTHIYAVLDLVKRFHEVVRDYRDMPADELRLSEAAKRRILGMYELSVVYFLKLTEKDRFVRSIDNQIAREMEADGYEDPIETQQLTGDVDDPNLEQLENPDGSFKDRTDMVAATSFIGHGVDVSRFNNMFFFGYPSRTFQYIQSSNRVGREVPGFVVDVFKPFDQRDAHRYRYFQKTHEYLDRAVEDVAVDRWSKFSLDRTFPGVFKGFFLQYFRPKMFREHDINLQSAWDLQDVIDPEAGESYSEFTTDRITEMLHRAYGVGDRQDDRPYFEDEIESRVDSNWDYWLTRGTEEHYTQFREDEMESLRDIGEEAEFSIDGREQTAFSSLTNN